MADSPNDGERDLRASEAAFEWPPSAADLASIEVIDIHASEVRPAATPPAPSSLPSAPSSAREFDSAPTPPPSSPGRPDVRTPTVELVDVVELDSAAGTSPYLIDLRTAAANDAPVAGPIRDSVPDSPVQVTALPADDVSWPPTEADLGEVAVIDLGSLGQPTSEAAERPATAPRPEVAAPLPARSAVTPVTASAAMIPVAARPVDTSRAEPVPTGRNAPLPAKDGGARDGDSRALAARFRWPLQIAAGLLFVALLALTFRYSTATGDGGAARESMSPPSPVADRAAGTAGIDHSAVPADAAGRVDAGLEAALAARASGDSLAAVRMAATGMRSTSTSAQAADLMREILDEARNGAARARRGAERAGGSATPAFAAAAGRESAALLDWREGRWESAFNAFVEAQAAFGRVRPDAQATDSPSDAPAAAAAPAAAPVASLGEPPPPAPVPSGAPEAVRPEATVNAGGAAPPAPPAPAVPAPAPPASATANRPAPESVASLAPDAAVEVRRVLAAYQGAYSRLDAQAASEVYPSVDVRALARAFGDLRSQSLDFERCDVSVADDARAARAACVGRAAFVPKVGSSTPSVESRRWNFTLEKQPSGWRITRTTISRQ